MSQHRDPAEYEQRRQQILAGALEVFASKGFEKATNRDIARAAGINSPGLIYYYFADKTDLLRQVAEHFMPVLQLLVKPEEFTSLPIRDALTLIATTYLRLLDNPKGVAAFRLLLSETARHPEFAHVVNSIGPQRGLRLLAGYMQRKMDEGVLRPMNPDAAARAFVGPIVAYILTREILSHAEARAIPPQEMATLAVEIFLHGAQIQPAPAAKEPPR